MTIEGGEYRSPPDSTRAFTRTLLKCKAPETLTF
jgi:hypothetical protein